MAETKSLKALAEAFDRRDTRRDGHETKPSHDRETPETISVARETVIYVDAADTYGTPADAVPIAWVERHGNAALVDALCVWGRRCTELVAGGDEVALRRAVGELVAALHAVRDEYAAAVKAGKVKP